MVHYIIPRVVSRNFKDEDGNYIKNKFEYFKNTIISNIHKLNIKVDGRWVEYAENSEKIIAQKYCTGICYITNT